MWPNTHHEFHFVKFQRIVFQLSDVVFLIEMSKSQLKVNADVNSMFKSTRNTMNQFIPYTYIVFAWLDSNSRAIYSLCIWIQWNQARKQVKEPFSCWETANWSSRNWKIWKFRVWWHLYILMVHNIQKLNKLTETLKQCFMSLTIV